MNINIILGGDGFGGAERVVSEICQHVPADSSVALLVFTLKNNTYNTGNVDISALDDVLTDTVLKKLLHILSRRTFFRIYVYYLYLKKQRFDVAISFLDLSNLVNMIISHHLRIPMVVSLRNNIDGDKRIKHKCIALSLLFFIKKYHPYIIVNSEENKEHLIKRCNLSPDKAICIYNPKDIDKIQSLQAESIDDNFFKTRDLILLNVGRLTLQKGQVHLLRIFNKLRQAAPCRLVISGQGELESQLKSFAHDLGIEQYVMFTGWCDNPYKYMNRADIFIFPSLYEGQPNAMIEALICGCPIVSADCDYGPREILDGGKYGVLTKKLDGKIADSIHDPLTYAEQDMYDKTLYLIEHPDVRKAYTELSKERIGIFAKERIINEYFSVFKAAAEGKKLKKINH